MSVVIATRDRREHLQRCLASLVAQKGVEGRFDLVIVNDGSSDGTDAFLATFQKSAPISVTVLNQENTGVAIARNRGIAAATGAVIAFTDDDCLPADDWIFQLLMLWEDTPDEVAGIGGPLDTVCHETTLVADYLRFIDEFNHLPVITPLVVRPVHKTKLKGSESFAYLRTANASFRATTLKQIGGFDSRFRRPGGEDPDLSYRLLSAGYQLRFSLNLRVDHLSRGDFGAYFGALRNYVRGEFIIRSKCDQYLIRSVRRTYSLIPLQKVISLGISILGAPLAAWGVAKKRGRVDRQMLLFPALIVASKIVALKVAMWEQFAGENGR